MSVGTIRGARLIRGYGSTSVECAQALPATPRAAAAWPEVEPEVS